ncbi:MAG: prenyltransferase/squalene oxidase repeat-containing protein [Planctomycetaceae bacterium]|nr:terpene cyclase/mutase family protein [Planctomycetaceae bacterium]
MKYRIAYRIIAVVLAAWMAMGPAALAQAPAGGVGVAEMTPAAEAAIAKALKFLQKSQQSDGSWGSYKVATTALTLMAYMVQGHFPDREEYGETMNKGVDFLLRQSATRRGYMGTSMYEHGLATLALSEVWGMSNRDELRDALKRAVDVILRAQNPAGGWRYSPQPTDADISVTVMQIVALASAKEAGIFVPDATISKAVSYVLSCQEKASGGFGYSGPSGPGFARTAAGVVSLMMCGQRGTEPVLAGLSWLLKMPDGQFESGEGHYFYAHYYGAQAMYQAGDKYYQQWYPRIRESLLKKQSPDGSWADGQNIGTQMAVLILGIPNRFLPIYQR